MSESFLAAAMKRSSDAISPPAPAAMSAESVFKVGDIIANGLMIAESSKRGRHLVLTRAAEAGETVLAEAPVCWWVDAERHDDVCARCLKVFDGEAHYTCGKCNQAAYCSEVCRKEDATRHAGVCGTLCACGQNLGAAATNLLQFVAYALALQRDHPDAFRQLWSLHSVGVILDGEEYAASVKVAERLAGLGGPPPPLLPSCGNALRDWREFVKELCKKDKASNMALTMPPTEGEGEEEEEEAKEEKDAGCCEEEEEEDDDDDEDDDDESGDDDEGLTARRVRAYCCYPTLSLANHSCLPTATRFDTFDSANDLSQSNEDDKVLPALPNNVCVGKLRDLHIRYVEALRPPYGLATRYITLHALPAGSEVTISYMPLGDPYSMRRNRLVEEYGFECDCNRCRVEAADENGEEEPTDTGEVNFMYVNLFVLKHTCAACMGTCAPIPIDGQPKTTLTCNRCGNIQTEEDFHARCEEHFAGSDDEEGEN